MTILFFVYFIFKFNYIAYERNDVNQLTDDDADEMMDANGNGIFLQLSKKIYFWIIFRGTHWVQRVRQLPYQNFSDLLGFSRVYKIFFSFFCFHPLLYYFKYLVCIDMFLRQLYIRYRKNRFLSQSLTIPHITRESKILKGEAFVENLGYFRQNQAPIL